MPSVATENCFKFISVLGYGRPHVRKHLMVMSVLWRWEVKSFTGPDSEQELSYCFHPSLTHNMKKYVYPCQSLLTKKYEFGHVGGISKVYFTWFPVKSLLHGDAGECCPLRRQERGEMPGVSGTGIELPGRPAVLGQLGAVLRSISASGTSRQPGPQWELAGLVRGCSVSRGTARIQTSGTVDSQAWGLP